MNTAIEKTEALIHSTRVLDAMYTDDPYRPRYHFTPPVRLDERYQRFESFGRDATISSINTTRKVAIGNGCNGATHQVWIWSIGYITRIALTPDLNGPDRDGCFSGGALVNLEGVPTFIYHGVPDGTCIATSDDDLLITWDKHPANPVIPVPKPGERGHGEYIVYDPCAWVEGDTYYALIGNTIPGQIGDGTALFKSSNLVDWEFVRSFYQSRRVSGQTRKKTAPSPISIRWTINICCCFVAIGKARSTTSVDLKTSSIMSKAMDG